VCYHLFLFLILFLAQSGLLLIGFVEPELLPSLVLFQQLEDQEMLDWPRYNFIKLKLTLTSILIQIILLNVYQQLLVDPLSL